MSFEQLQRERLSISEVSDKIPANRAIFLFRWIHVCINTQSIKVGIAADKEKYLLYLHALFSWKAVTIYFSNESIFKIKRSLLEIQTIEKSIYKMPSGIL